jgi:hypothetical protein
MSDEEEVQSDWEPGDESGEMDDSLDGCDVVIGGLAMIADDDLSCCLIDDHQDDKIEETVTSDADTSCNSLSVVILNLQEEQGTIDESSSLSCRCSPRSPTLQLLKVQWFDPSKTLWSAMLKKSPRCSDGRNKWSRHRLVLLCLLHAPRS